MDEAEGGKDVPMEGGRSKDTCLCEAGAEEAADCDVISEHSGSGKGSIEVGGRVGPGTREYELELVCEENTKSC